MDSKKVGVTLVILGLVLGGFVLNMASELNHESSQNECNPSQQCKSIASQLSFSHVAIGFLGAIVALGVYLLFFNTSEKEILERLEKEKEKKVAQERLAIMLQALDENEKKVLKAISDQDGITQKTLTLRTGLSKSKVSQVLSSFEDKGLIRRKAKGKTYSVHLAKSL